MIEQSHADAILAEVEWERSGSIEGFISSALNDRERIHRAYYQQIEMNVAWYDGRQNLYLAPDRVGLSLVPNPRKRVRLTYNLIQPTVQVMIAKLGNDAIQPEVMPATTDHADEERARLGTHVLRYYREYLSLAELEEQADTWAALAGESFVKVCWDPAAGDRVDLRSMAESIGVRTSALHRALDTGQTGDSMAIGDPAINIIPPFHVHWGPIHAPFEDAEWVIELHERSRAYVMERYGLDASDSDAVSSQAVEVYRPEASGSAGHLRGFDSRDRCLIAELWVKPNQKCCPGGRHVVALAHGKVLLNTELPYQHGEIPIRRFVLERVPNQLHGRSPITDMIPPQADYNRAVSQATENRETMAQPVVYAEKGAPVDPESWNGVAGGLRLYKGGTAPKHEPGQGMPASVLVWAQRAQMAIQDLASVRDVSQAKVPASVKSGRAILALQEADNQRIGGIYKRRRRFWEHVYRLLLQVVVQYVREPRLVRIFGDENRMEVAKFEGESLVGEKVGAGADYYDVRVRTTGVPQSRAEQTERVAMALEAGLLDPKDPAQRQMAMSLMELGDATGRLDPTKADRNLQQSEIRTMLADGKLVQPNWYDDDAMHQIELHRFLKSPAARELNPDQIALLQQHDFLHDVNKARRALRAQAAVQMALAGAPLTGAAPAAVGDASYESGSDEPVAVAGG